MPSPVPGAGRGRSPGHRLRLRQLEQLVHVLGPGGAGLLHERAEHALVAGHRAGVGGGGERTGGGGAHLQDGHAHAAVGALGECLAEADAVAVGLQVHGDRAHALVARELGDPVGGIDRRGVAARDDRVEAQPALGGERVDRHVPALRDERHAPGLERPERVAPERHALVELDDAVAVGAADGQAVPPRRRLELALELRALGDLAESGPVDHGAAAAEGAGLLDHRRHARRRVSPPPRRRAARGGRRAWGSTESRAPPRAPG